MLNSLLLNTAQLNSGFPLPFAFIAPDSFDDFEYNGFSLQDTTIISSEVDAFSPPRRELVTYNIPRDHGGGFNGDYFRGRDLGFSGIIRTTTAEEMNTLLDTFKRAMTASEAYLYLKFNGEMRRIKATLQNPQEMFRNRKGYHITFVPFDLNFLSLEPFWHSVGYTSFGYESITDLLYPDEIEVEGSWMAKPVVVLIIENATSANGISFTNTTNGDSISVTQSLVAGDVVIIDSETKSVKLNGTEIDYDGIFPEFEVGVNAFEIEADASAIQYTATLKYRKTYL